MTTDAPNRRAPILVLGLGNLLLRDDGVGLALLECLRPAWADDDRIELLDGGTQGIALLPHLEGRRALLVLDAVAHGGAPGAIHIVADACANPSGRGATAHECNAGDLLAAAAFAGDVPDAVSVVGIEPKELRTGIGLSPSVYAARPEALAAAQRQLALLIDRLEALQCTS